MIIRRLSYTGTLITVTLTYNYLALNLSGIDLMISYVSLMIMNKWIYNNEFEFLKFDVILYDNFTLFD